MCRDRRENAPHRQDAGFTLIEVMVVVVIVALVGGISMLALSQALSRPVTGQAERLGIWLEDLSDRARLQGTAYGIRPEGPRLEALVYYRDQWLPLRTPEPFTLDNGLVLQMPGDAGGRADDSADSERRRLPVLTFSGAGPEPGTFQLMRGETGETLYEYRWDEEGDSLEGRIVQEGRR